MRPRFDLRNAIINSFSFYPEAWIIGVGIILRLRHFLENRAFWLDETCAAISITSRSFSEIGSGHEILTEFARLPMLFSIIEKFVVAILGNNEMALRLFPFLCGIGALILFQVVTKRTLSRRPFLISLTFFALAEPLVYYSAELKQYSTDLLCAIALIDLSRRLLEKEFRLSYCLLLAFTGALALWLSNAMIFVLAGAGMVFLLNKPWKKGQYPVIRLCGIAIVWLMSFVLLYNVSLRHMVGNSSITDTWKGAFCTSPIFSFQTVAWGWTVITESFPNPVGLKWWWFILPCFLLGVRVLWRKDRNTTLLWLLPIVLTFLAALLGKYPFYGRVLLFLTAGYYIFIACAIDRLLARIQPFGKKWVFIILAVVFIQPITDAGYHAIHSRSKTENRAVMNFLADYYKPGDFIYLSTLAQEPFWYYAGMTGLSRTFPQPIIGFADGKLIRGFKIAKFALDPKEINGQEYLFFRNEYNIFDDNGMFRSVMSSQKDSANIAFVPLNAVYPYPPTGRTWLIVSGPSPLEAGVNALIRGSFDKKAKRLLSYDALNAGVYLYDLQ